MYGIFPLCCNAFNGYYLHLNISFYFIVPAQTVQVKLKEVQHGKQQALENLVALTHTTITQITYKNKKLYICIWNLIQLFIYVWQLGYSHFQISKTKQEKCSLSI